MKKWGVLLIMLILFISVLALTGCSNGGDTDVSTESMSEDITAGDETAAVSEETTLAGNTGGEDLGAGLPPIDREAFTGYWRKVEEDDNGTIEDLSEYPIYFMEVTENRLYIITTSLNPDEGYSSADKYYVLDGAYCYYDYDEITQDNYKNAIDSPWGGRFVLSFDTEDRLVVAEYYNDLNKDEGYVISTYVKIPANEWPISD